LIHEGGFGLRISAVKEICFSDLNGIDIPTAAQPRSRGNVSSLFQQNRQSGIQITPKTLDCHWDGVEMDHDMAIMGLLQCE
jgi:hypothetical protein